MICAVVTGVQTCALPICLVPARAAVGQEEPVFANIPIDTFAMPMDDQMRAAFAELVKGRYVLIGGDIIDNDQFNTPLSRFPDAIAGQHETMIGLEVHAHMLAQQLDNADRKSTRLNSSH